MLEVYERLGCDDSRAVSLEVVLDHDQRDKGRLRCESRCGEEVRIFLERGKALLIGEILRSQCGKYLRVLGAEQAVATARCESWADFSRACYHLGNRHTKMQIGERWLRITPDHVLEELLALLGLDVVHEQAVFVPESGAYSGGHHHH